MSSLKTLGATACPWMVDWIQDVRRVVALKNYRHCGRAFTIRTDSRRHHQPGESSRQAWMSKARALRRPTRRNCSIPANPSSPWKA